MTPFPDADQAVAQLHIHTLFQVPLNSAKKGLQVELRIKGATVRSQSCGKIDGGELMHTFIQNLTGVSKLIFMKIGAEQGRWVPSGNCSEQGTQYGHIDKGGTKDRIKETLPLRQPTELLDKPGG